MGPSFALTVNQTPFTEKLLPTHRLFLLHTHTHKNTRKQSGDANPQLYAKEEEEKVKEQAEVRRIKQAL